MYWAAEMWVIESPGGRIRWLEPLHRLMHAELLESGYEQFDETPIHYNDPDHAIIPIARLGGYLAWARDPAP